jgi:hypothetical protein
LHGAGGCSPAPWGSLTYLRDNPSTGWAIPTEMRTIKLHFEYFKGHDLQLARTCASFN